MFEKIREEAYPEQINKLANYLQSKVSKMQREYLELLFMMLFENISKKDEVIEMIAKGQTQNHVSKKVYKTVIQPKFEVIPFNVRSIENILNKAYIVDKSGKVKVKESKDFGVQTEDDTSKPYIFGIYTTSIYPMIYQNLN